LNGRGTIEFKGRKLKRTQPCWSREAHSDALQGGGANPPGPLELAEPPEPLELLELGLWETKPLIPPEPLEPLEPLELLDP
jgi:hypothetical protein